jgi:hypothetical protein
MTVVNGEPGGVGVDAGPSTIAHLQVNAIITTGIDAIQSLALGGDGCLGSIDLKVLVVLIKTRQAQGCGPLFETEGDPFIAEGYEPQHCVG